MRTDSVSIFHVFKHTSQQNEFTTNRRPVQIKEILKIDIKSSWKNGTKITFVEKGNQKPEMTPGDLIFVVDEKPHALFKRDENDLIVNQKISLIEALMAKTLNLIALDDEEGQGEERRKGEEEETRWTRQPLTPSRSRVSWFQVERENRESFSTFE